MSISRELFKDLVRYIPSFVVPGIVSLVSLSLFTNYIEPDQWGIYSLLTSSIELLSLLSLGWLTNSIVRYYTESLEQSDTEGFETTVLGSAILLISLVLVGAFILTTAFNGTLRENNLLYIMYIGLWIYGASALVRVVGGMLRAKRKALLVSALISWQYVSRLVLGLLLIVMFGLGVGGILLGWAIGMTIGVVLLGNWAFQHVGPRHFKIGLFSWSRVRSMLRFGTPIVAGDFSFWLLRVLDRYILGAFLGVTAVGIYAIGVDITNRSLLLLVSALIISSWPLVVQVWEKEGERKTAIFLRNLMRIYLVLCVPAVVGISILRQPIISALTDEAYLGAYQVMPFIALSTFLYGFQRWFQLVLLLYEKTKFIFISVLSGAVVNIVLNLLLIRHWGYQIAAVNQLIGYAVFTLLIIVFSRRLMVWEFPAGSLARVIAATAIMSVAVIIVSNLIRTAWLNLILGAAVGIVTYSLGLLAMQEVKLSEIRGLMASLVTESSQN